MRRPKAPSKVDLLKSVPLFAGLSKQSLAEIAKVADEVELAEGKVLIKEGQPGQQFFVLIEGGAQVLRTGKDPVALGAGDFFGEIALVANRPTVATVALTEPTTALVITRPAFRGMLLSHPEVQMQVLEAMAERVLDLADS